MTALKVFQVKNKSALIFVNWIQFVDLALPRLGGV